MSRYKKQAYKLKLKKKGAWDEETEAKAEFGRLAAYKVTFERLRAYHTTRFHIAHWKNQIEIDYKKAGLLFPVGLKDETLKELSAEKAKLEKQLQEEMIAALAREDVAYFEALTDMMKMVDDGPPSPVDAVLIHLLKFRSPEGQAKLIAWAGKDKKRLREARMSNKTEIELLPNWPPTIAELYDYLYYFLKSDDEPFEREIKKLKDIKEPDEETVERKKKIEKIRHAWSETIRKRAAFLGFQIAAGKRGAPKKSGK